MAASSNPGTGSIFKKSNLRRLRCLRLLSNCNLLYSLLHEPKKTDLLERVPQIFVSSFLVTTPLQRYLNLLNEKPVNVLLAESV